MPAIINCPDCGRQLRVPDDLLGKKVKCPGCKVMFTAFEESPSEEEAPPPPPPPPRRRPPSEEIRPAPRRPAKLQEDDDYDRDPGPARDDDYDGPEEDDAGGGGNQESWRRVRDGIGYILVGIWILIGTFFCYFLGGILASLVGSSSAGSATGLGATIGMTGFLFLLVFAGYLIGSIYLLVGLAHCMVVPGGKGKGAFARGLVIGSFSCVATVYAALIGQIVFLFFLWSMAHLIRRKDLAAQVRTYLYALVFVWVGGFGGLLLALLVGILAKTLILIFIVLGLLGLANLALFIWYIVLLYGAKSAVSSHLRRF